VAARFRHHRRRQFLAARLGYQSSVRPTSENAFGVLHVEERQRGRFVPIRWNGKGPAGNNRNGYADFLLGNFSSFLATDTIQFHFVLNNANDGIENVFLIGAPGTPTATPKLTSMALIGSGLLFIAAKFRKKAKL